MEPFTVTGYVYRFSSDSDEEFPITVTVEDGVMTLASRNKRMSGRALEIVHPFLGNPALAHLAEVSFYPPIEKSPPHALPFRIHTDDAKRLAQLVPTTEVNTP